MSPEGYAIAAIYARQDGDHWTAIADTVDGRLEATGATEIEAVQRVGDQLRLYVEGIIKKRGGAMSGPSIYVPLGKPPDTDG